MTDSDYEQTTHSVAELKCGCQINENSGELHQECLSHEQAHFMK